MLHIFSLLAVAKAGPILLPDMTNEEQFGETYTMVADLSDGSFLLFQILFSNVGFGDGGGGCRLMYVPKGKDGINRKEQFSSSEWTYTESTKELKAGTCSIREYNGVRFSAEVDDIKVDLQTEGSLRKYKFPGEKSRTGDQFYQSEILLNNTSIEGTVSADGQQKRVSGRAYMDHNRSNIILKDVGTLWVRYRGFYGADPMLFQVYKDLSGEKIAWLWENEEASPKIAPYSIQLKDVNHSNIYVTVGDIEIQSTAQLFVFRPMENYGMLGSLAKGIIGDFSTVTFDARASQQGEVISEGILEVTFID